eukprot:CAMPEP_0180137618 /NCGR_PEP_ID=MMETSP0986-20121125/12342_1 /TAXON_ID=697907 /ORGANISM="non described non described, Strain CCMP2293" /LENGTH=510 /DNA_ID=CAMNT_0022079159 /DNA_START=44 /DNA_END=1576 /DNA_ORIENTATION=+
MADAIAQVSAPMLASTAMSCMVAISALYYRTCPVPYRINDPRKLTLDFKNQPLQKYEHAHIGYKPELAPQNTHEGWDGQLLFTASDGKGKIVEFHTAAKGVEPHAVVLLLPGLGDTAHKFGHVASALAARDFAVHGMDYPGWGKSQSDAGSGSSYTPCLTYDWGKEVCEEVIFFARRLQKWYGDVPMFIAGPSLGGGTALRCCMMAPDLFTGAVLLCPATKTDAQPFLQKIAPLIAWAAPRLAVGSIGDDDIGSRNLKVYEMIVNDQGKSNMPILAASGNAMLKHLLHVRSNLASMKVPFHVIHGKKDLVIDPACSQELIDQAASTDKSITWLEDAWHELFFEPEWREVIDTMGAWMTARIPKGEKQPLEPFSNAPLEPLTKMSEGGSSPQGLKLKGFDTPKDTKELKMNNNLSGYNNKLSGYWNSAAELRSPGSPVPGGAHEVTPGNDSPKGLKDPGFPKELKASDSPPKGVEEGAVPNEVEGYVSEGGLLKGLAEPLSESDSPKELAR